MEFSPEGIPYFPDDDEPIADVPLYSRELRDAVLDLTDPGLDSAVLTLGANWGVAGGATPTIRRKLGLAWVVGIQARASGSAGPFTVPAGYRPPFAVTLPVSSLNSGNTDGPRMWLDVNPDGTTALNATSGIAWSSSTWVIWQAVPWAVA